MNIEAKAVQRRLGVKADGIWGPLSWAALFRFCGCKNLHRADALGRAAHKYLNAYGINTPLRIVHFFAQAGHETGGFLWLEEIWGPTAAQKRYEGRVDLGNVQKGDGLRFKGRGVFQLTGRDNYERYGKALGLDLVSNPSLAADPETSLLIACHYWRERGINALADADKSEAVTRKVNGGTNGYADRVARLCRLKEVLL